MTKPKGKSFASPHENAFKHNKYEFNCEQRIYVCVVTSDESQTNRNKIKLKSC